MGYNIAIDGPAGAGKSTIAKRVAKELGYVYVDTGAMYRALAIYFLNQGLGTDDTEKIAEACKHAEVTLQYENGVQQVYLNGENVTGFLREEAVGNMASVGNSGSTGTTFRITKRDGKNKRCCHGRKGYRYKCAAECRGQSILDCKRADKGEQKISGAVRQRTGV